MPRLCGNVVRPARTGFANKIESGIANNLENRWTGHFLRNVLECGKRQTAGSMVCLHRCHFSFYRAKFVQPPLKFPDSFLYFVRVVRLKNTNNFDSVNPHDN